MAITELFTSLNNRLSNQRTRTVGTTLPSTSLGEFPTTSNADLKNNDRFSTGKDTSGPMEFLLARCFALVLKSLG